MKNLKDGRSKVSNESRIVLWMPLASSGGLTDNATGCRTPASRHVSYLAKKQTKSKKCDDMYVTVI